MVSNTGYFFLTHDQRVKNRRGVGCEASPPELTKSGVGSIAKTWRPAGAEDG